MSSLIPLVADIVKRYAIRPPYVVGHSDIAPTRKQDPGELFDWQRLARLGLAMPRPVSNLIDPQWTDGGFLLALERYGYDVRNAQAAVRAFQRRFRPEHLTGEIDGECRAILLALLLDRRSAPPR
jgi:N-acetylmuramoyl-L-alanine amidase